ncbi:transcriptional repressor NF-X1-like [Triticum dicoccoides]|uniref:transcriptional repressor NF-X1-like n=1 Tax=Triticum dicoccoides TaxID=85692 RepID=UPI00188ECFDB|nr:transcriptional repressor NF-X1-like [Triticum dicoccoides]
MAAAAPPRRIGRSTVHMDGGGADRPTPAIDGVGGTSSGAGAGRRPGTDLFSGPVCAAVFVSFALCIVAFCVYSFLARRRAIFDARRRFLGRVRDNFNRLSEWSTDGPVPRSPPAATPPASVTTADRVDEPPPPVATTPPGCDVPPPPPGARTATCDDMPPPRGPAPARPARGDTSNSRLGNCLVCLEPLHGRTNIMAAHECAHVFHASCIEPWLHNRGSCPVCQYTAIPTSIPIPDPASASTSTSIGDCPVCLEPLLLDCGDVRAAHACGHVFHSCCIEPWLNQQGSCPVCRCTVNSTFTSTSTSIPTPTTTSTTNSTPISDTIGYCPVCLEPLRAGSGDIRAAHACGHVFHSRCIERWVRRRGSCPVCRCTVRFNPNSTYNLTSMSTSNPTTNTNPTYIPTSIPTPTPTPNSTSNSGPVGECPVCLEPLSVGGGDMKAAHVCGHVFHSRCIERWLRHRNSCPVCRCTVTCSHNP